MSTDHGPEPLIEALKRLVSGTKLPEDLRELQQALDSCQVDIDTASSGGIIIKGNVSGGNISTTTNTFVLPREVLKLLQLPQPAYRPPVLPSPEVLAERRTLPPGSRLLFSPNKIFTGRQEDLLELAGDLLYAQKDSEDLAQGLVVTGMGGLGKTQLAVEFCYRYGRFFQGVHWLNAMNMQAEIAENGLAMGLPYWPDKFTEQVQATLRAWQEGGQRLIVLDNAEDLQVMQDWLPRLPSAGLLITSKEQNWPPDLALKVKRLGVFSRGQSIELLHKLAPRLKGVPSGPLDKLAGYLGDLPLALDLAGRYLADRSELFVEDYLRELKEAGSALKHTAFKDWVKHSPTKHATSLAATFTLSWEQLTAEDELAKRLFRIAGYCAPNTLIPRQLLAKTVGPDVPDHELDRALRKLYSLGLMEPVEGGRRMHSLLAEFARLKDKDSGESVLPILAKAMDKLTTEALRSGLPENMKPLHEHLDTVAQKAEKSNLQITGALWNNLGCFLRVLADYEGARKDLERALKIDEQVFGPEHPNVARDINNIGSVLYDMGDLQGAKERLERAIKIGEKVYGPDHSEVATYVNDFGSVLQALGELQKARECFERALRIDEQVLGPEDPNVARDVNNLGSVLQDLGELQEARKCYQRALKIDENSYGPNHREVARYVNNLGMVLRDLGELQQARECFERALRIGEKVYGPDHPEVARYVNNLGMVLRDLGELQQARECFERALNILREKLGPDHPTTRLVANNLNSLSQGRR